MKFFIPIAILVLTTPIAQAGQKKPSKAHRSPSANGSFDNGVTVSTTFVDKIKSDSDSLSSTKAVQIVDETNNVVCYGIARSSIYAGSSISCVKMDKAEADKTAKD